MTTPVCPCGLPKTMTGTISVCPHCDTDCKYAPHCPRCRTYTIKTSQRVTTEHAREKTNG